MLRDRTVAGPKAFPHALTRCSKNSVSRTCFIWRTTCRMYAPVRPKKCYFVSFNTKKGNFSAFMYNNFCAAFCSIEAGLCGFHREFEKQLPFVKGNTNVNYRTIILVKYEWNNKNWYSKWARKNMLKVKREDTTSNANKIFVRARPYHRRFAFHAEKWTSSGDFHAVKVLHVSFNNRNGTLFGNRFCEN